MGPVIENILDQRPRAQLCDPRTAVLEPYTVAVDVWDADGSGSPPAASPRQPADLSSGPGRTGVLSGMNSTQPWVIASISGPEVTVALSVRTQPPLTRLDQVAASPEVVDHLLGGAITVTANVDPPGVVILEVADMFGGSFEVARGDFSGVARLSWNGTDPRGSFVPYGDYELRLVTPGGSVSIPVPVKLELRPTLEFANVVEDFPTDGNTRAALPAVSFATPDDAEVTWTIEQLTSHGCKSLGSDVSARVSAATPTRLVWSAKDAAGSWIPPGRYCSVLTAVRLTDGKPYAPSETDDLIIAAPSPIFVEVRTHPEIPALVPSAVREVVARARNARGDLRTTARLDVFADEFLPGHTQRGLVLIGSCTQTAECRVLLPPPRASGTIAIRAEARDLDQLLPDDSGVRLVDLVQGPRGVDLRVNVATMLEGQFVVELPRRFGVDVAFHGSFDGPNDGPVDHAPFSAAVARQIDHFRGFTAVVGGTIINPNTRPSSIQENIDRTSFWAVAESAVVIGSGGSVLPADDPCQVARASWSGTADVNAVLHNHSQCRDNALLRHYTSSVGRPTVGWHELHHSPFQESDEYCCDTVYFQHPTEPNLYANLSECMTRSSNPGTCSMIVDPGTGQSLPLFISDPPMNDVMTDATVENADDLRRVRAHYAQCARGGC